MTTKEETSVATGARRRQAGSVARFYAFLAALAAGGMLWLGFTAQPRAATLSGAVAFDTALAREARGYTIGRPNAPVQVVEFADFECPGCALFARHDEPELRKRLVESGEVSFTFMDFPLAQHHNAMRAHLAAACADADGRFWEMHDQLYAGQREWNTEVTNAPDEVFARYARTAGVNVSRWQQCVDARQFERRILANREDGLRRRVGGTPSLFVNGQRLAAASFRLIRAAVDSVRAAAQLPVASRATP